MNKAMNKKYFAGFDYSECKKERIHFKSIDSIAVFNSEKERDEWVNFEDWFSKFTGETKECPIFNRVPLSDDEILKIYGQKFFDSLEENLHTSCDGINWIDLEVV